MQHRFEQKGNTSNFWVGGKYVQVFANLYHFNNRVDRYIFGCLCKIFKEDYRDVIFEDETAVEIRITGYKNYKKPASDILRVVGSKFGKHKHSNVKTHLLGGITRRGLTPLVIFNGRMESIRFQHYLTLGHVLYIRHQMPLRHRHFMDYDTKHKSGSTCAFSLANCM